MCCCSYLRCVALWRTYQGLLIMHQTPKIKKIISELHKASRTHKGQAERLEKILKVMQNVEKKNG